MITSPPPPSDSYTLIEELRGTSAPLAVHQSRMDDSSWEDLALTKLGTKSWGRLVHFRQFYQQSWGNQQGQALSPRAFDAFVRFLTDAEFPTKATKPSVFLTDSGGLELCWESTTGKAVQVEFTRNAVEYFNEETGIDGEISFSSLGDLKQILAV